MRQLPHNQQLAVMVGPIAAGKSTFSRHLAERGWIVVNDDVIVSALHAGIYTNYDENLKPVYKAVMDTAVRWALTRGYSVVIDRPNLKKSTRLHYKYLAESLDIEDFTCFMFENKGPEVHAHRRVASDGRGHDYDYWLRVYETHQRQYEPVTEDEGWNIEHIDITTL